MPSKEVEARVADLSINCESFPFNSRGRFAALNRVNALRVVKGEFEIIHARGDLPALAAVLRRKELVFWDIRSLWLEQKRVLNPRRFDFVIRLMIDLMTKFTSRRVFVYNILTNAVDQVICDKYPRFPFRQTIVST